MFSTPLVSLLTLALVATHSLAATHTVTVGGNGTKTYEPNTITADLGDIVNFVFAGGNHTVTQSKFADPCTNSGFKSGFRPATNTSTSTFSIMINSTDPIWVYCAQTGHCKAGMVMAINPATTGDKTFAAFQTLAMSGAATNGTSNSTGSFGSGSGSKTSGSIGSDVTGSATVTPAGASGSSTATGGAQGAVTPSFLIGGLGLLVMSLGTLL